LVVETNKHHQGHTIVIGLICSVECHHAGVICVQGKNKMLLFFIQHRTDTMAECHHACIGMSISNACSLVQYLHNHSVD
jgi:hypothetical protein